MKKICLLIVLLFVAWTTSFAQCGKKLMVVSSKTEHLDEQGNVTRTDDEKAVVIISKTDIKITVSDPGGSHEMTGTVKSDTCNWTVAYKEGKSVIKADITGMNGDEKPVTITITGTGGKVILLFEIDGEPGDDIRVAADKFDEAM
jgi:hypothetical protein